MSSSVTSDHWASNSRSGAITLGSGSYAHALATICCSVTQLCPTHCDRMDCSMLGFPILHYLSELLKLISIKSKTPSNYLILCCPFLLLPSIFPRIRVFSNELALPIKWPKYWSFSFSISPSSEYSGLISWGLTGLISLLSEELSRVFSSTIIWKHPFLGAQLSLWSSSYKSTWLPEKP